MNQQYHFPADITEREWSITPTLEGLLHTPHAMAMERRKENNLPPLFATKREWSTAITIPLCRYNPRYRTDLPSTLLYLERESPVIPANISRYLTDVQQTIQEIFGKYDAATIDLEVTGFFKREQFHHDLKTEVEKALAKNTPLSMLVLDSNNLKLFNDRGSYARGTDYLKATSKLILGVLRDTTRAYRFGGDEVAVLLPNTTYEQAKTVQQHIYAATTREQVLEELLPLPKTYELAASILAYKQTVAIGVAELQSSKHKWDSPHRYPQEGFMDFAEEKMREDKLRIKSEPNIFI